MIIYLVVVIILGFGSKFYRGPAEQLMNNYIAGLMYEIFWCLVVYMFWRPGKGFLIIPGLVFIMTSILEFLQLWDPPLLHWIRSFFIGKALIGTTFSVGDFGFYFVGVVIGGWLIRGFQKIRCC